MRCANVETIEEWKEAPARSSLFRTRIRLGTPYLGQVVKVRVCEALERMAYLLTCPIVAKHLSFVLLLPLQSL